MCGRFALKKPIKEALVSLGVEAVPDLEPREDIAPMQPVGIVRQKLDKSRLEFQWVQWGLIPSWTKDPNKRALLINARAETLAEKPSFRGPYRYKRCLIPADGFYEWKKEGATKRRYLIEMKDQSPFFFAGIWEHWLGPYGEEVESCAIITTKPNALIKSIHDRMPVILQPKDYTQWLDRQLHHPNELNPLLQSYPDTQMTAKAC